jgi:hypothetical protein
MGPANEEDFSPGGVGMALLEEAEADVRVGRIKPMNDFLTEAKAKHKAQNRRS